VLNDIVVDPHFLRDLGFNPTEIFTALRALPSYRAGEPIQAGGPHGIGAVMWVPGTHASLHIRGHSLKRDKIWLQTNYSDGYRKYGYTGFQWAVAEAQRDVSAVPVLARLMAAINSRVLAPHPAHFNHVIATKYEDGNGNIGAHSDKVASCVC
jgi:hypothetical protein